MIELTQLACPALLVAPSGEFPGMHCSTYVKCGTLSGAILGNCSLFHNPLQHRKHIETILNYPINNKVFLTNSEALLKTGAVDNMKDELPT